MSFPEQRIMLRVHEEVFNFKFTSVKEITNRFCNLRLMSIDTQTQQPLRKVKVTQIILPQVVETSHFRIGRATLARAWKTASTS
jgi:hypothetical protein